ncbi:murein biosynthesis integral membrane protein MurJ [Solimonas sp. K1W22B-7]|uniref:murein biosynthesis integral membrane protein MurJ n=1 Tax=Solimonas sp. K1W22B-7 TaxID=2303331 RepID=UPI000E334989|nr:murein biosynthesis integral membrane protein MurJ [Solimonas sp. K1W22B-7]AXQ28952.1 murein biosynthesis integral membrane protein MurJ [Solimonas sp. K1W22B-7]
MSKSMLKSSGIVSLMTLLSRVLGFVRDVMFARAFGASAGMDAFLVALKIPNFGRRMFAEGAFSQAFVPVFTEVRTTRPHEEVRDLVAVTMGTLGGVLAIITLVGCLAAPLLLWLFAPGFGGDPAKQALGTELLRWTFPYLMFISLTAMASGVLNSYGQFAIPAITPVILNLCLIGSAFIDSQSVQVLAYAVFVAGILQFMFQWPALRKLGMLPRPRWGWKDLRVRRIITLMLPILFGASVQQISLLLDTILASLLVNGSVSWLYYADRLMEFPLGIFSIAVATVVLPSLAAQHASRSPEDFSATLDWGLRTILLIGVPAAMGLFLLAGPLTTTLFQYNAFNPHDVRMTTWALMAYAFGFMGFSLVKVLIPGFYARQETRLPVRFGLVAIVSGMVMSGTFVGLSVLLDFEAPHAGLALATSLSAWINAGLLFRRLRQDGVYRPQPGWRGFALRLLAANAVMAVLILAFSPALSAWIAAGLQQRGSWILGLVTAAMAAYFATLWLSGMRPAHFRRSR